MRIERWLAAAAFLCGTAAWVVYAERGLVLSHYDAKAHLVVARRVIDSLTPGWQQLGAVWLPLPHLLQVLPTQVDWLYETGLFGSLLSVAAFAVSVWAAARLVRLLTGSVGGAAVAGLLLLLNPNLLYLHSTPMTEPLLLAALLLAVLWTFEWLSSSPTAAAPARARWALFAAMWTRYEAWPVVAALLVIGAYVRMSPGRIAADPKPDISPGLISESSGVLRLALWPGAAALLFVLNSRITVGSWFVTGGFYERDPLYDGQFWRSLVAVWWGTGQLGGFVVETVALLVLVLVTSKAVRRGDVVARLVPAALFAAAALPMYAFYSGHPFRIRYMMVSAVACALFGGLGVGVLRRKRLASALAVLLVASSLVESPIATDGPLLDEAQWDVPRSQERRAVTACLAPHYGGEKVMASMGSLAHYMQELSHEGFTIADFLHEGNGVIWHAATETGPAPHAGWMLVEEQAEGGDVLAQRIRADGRFARGMTRVCEGGGVALYRRDDETRGRPDTDAGGTN